MTECINRRALHDGNDRQCSRQQVEAVVRHPDTQPDRDEGIRVSKHGGSQRLPCRSPDRTKAGAAIVREQASDGAGTAQQQRRCDQQAANEDDRQDWPLRLCADGRCEPLLDEVGGTRHGEGADQGGEREHHRQCGKVGALR